MQTAQAKAQSIKGRCDERRRRAADLAPPPGNCSWGTAHPCSWQGTPPRIRVEAKMFIFAKMASEKRVRKGFFFTMAKIVFKIFLYGMFTMDIDTMVQKF